MTSHGCYSFPRGRNHLLLLEEEEGGLLHHDGELHLHFHRLVDDILIDDKVEGDVPSGFLAVAVGVDLDAPAMIPHVGTLPAASKQASILRSWYPLGLSATMAEDDPDGLPRPEVNGMANNLAAVFSSTCPGWGRRLD